MFFVFSRFHVFRPQKGGTNWEKRAHLGPNPWQIQEEQEEHTMIALASLEEDDDQKQGERVSSRAVPEDEIPRPEAGEEMDVGEPAVRGNVPPVQPAPTYQEGGSSGSGSGSKANEMNTDNRLSKRVRFGDSRRQKRQGEDLEELAANAEEQHLEADC